MTPPTHDGKGLNAILPVPMPVVRLASAPSGGQARAPRASDVACDTRPPFTDERGCGPPERSTLPRNTVCARGCHVRGPGWLFPRSLSHDVALSAAHYAAQFAVAPAVSRTSCRPAGSRFASPNRLSRRAAATIFKSKNYPTRQSIAWPAAPSHAKVTRPPSPEPGRHRRRLDHLVPQRVRGAPSARARPRRSFRGDGR